MPSNGPGFDFTHFFVEDFALYLCYKWTFGMVETEQLCQSGAKLPPLRLPS
jgi:hypothetical protein